MKPDELMGRWISFYADPPSMSLLLPDPGRKRYCGQVIEVKPLAPAQPGNVPTAAVTVRGRTGKTMTLDFSACFARVHDTQAEAIAATETSNTAVSQSATSVESQKCSQPRRV